MHTITAIILTVNEILNKKILVSYKIIIVFFIIRVSCKLLRSTFLYNEIEGEYKIATNITARESGVLPYFSMIKMLCS